MSEGQRYVLGDNSDSSRDLRDKKPVPYAGVRGRGEPVPDRR